MKNKTNLKTYRRKSPLLQQDISHILNIDSGLYCRIEKGKRPPTLDIILLFHILFGTSVKDLFFYDYKALKEKILTRSKTLIEQLKTEQPPKSIYRITCLNTIVNKLERQQDHE